LATAEIADPYDIPIIENDIHGMLGHEKAPRLFAIAAKPEFVVGRHQTPHAMRTLPGAPGAIVILKSGFERLERIAHDPLRAHGRL
jgi:DNA-binding transcriptional MocR family regulator